MAYLGLSVAHLILANFLRSTQYPIDIHRSSLECMISQEYIQLTVVLLRLIIRRVSTSFQKVYERCQRIFTLTVIKFYI